eukprot:SAG11_NODE_286_length_11220_cov_11.922399_1_plen_155_part_00
MASAGSLSIQIPDSIGHHATPMGTGLMAPPTPTSLVGAAAAASARMPGEVTVPNSAKRYRDSATTKGPWTAEEDELLKKLVEEHSPSKWSLIASHMENRNGKQCRERWLNHLSAGIRKGVWSEEEEQLLVDAHQVMPYTFQHSRARGTHESCGH